MRVISKQKDYYDNIGFNSDYPVFIRNTKEIHQNEDGIFSCLDSNENKTVKALFSSIIRMPYVLSEYSIKIYAVHVCGYTMLIVHVIDKPFNNTESMIDYLSSKDKKFSKHYDYYMKNYRTKPFLNYHGELTFDILDDGIFGAWEYNYNYNTSIINNLMYKFDSPIFMFDFSEKCIIINPVLKNINFQNIIDPYTMHQKIEMCLSNELVKENDIPEFNDELKRDMHGMDEWSFKKKKNV